MPSTGTLHIDSALTDVSVMYTNDDMVANEVFPTLPVDKRSNKYFVYSQDNFRADDDLRAPGAEADESNWDLSTDTYYADGHAKAAVIPDEWRENEDAALDIDIDTTTMLTEQIWLRREVNAVTQVAAGLTPTDLSASTYANAWDTDTADPIKQIDLAKKTIKRATGKKANRLLISEPVFLGLRNNALVKARISGAPDFEASLITEQMLAAVLGVEKLVIGGAVYATTKPGQVQANDYVWGKYALLYYKPPTPGKRTVSLGYEMTWNKGRLGSLVYRFRLDPRHSDKIEVMRYYDLKVVAAGAGVLWSNAIQNA
ncbi:MAG TPA: hypothetical protein VG273_11825 [Bryobacteraceae bacterium]|jgi:hypothetical protein|nr:hypothetical protein [Bryobacteraceae bacterium]